MLCVCVCVCVYLYEYNYGECKKIRMLDDTVYCHDHPIVFSVSLSNFKQLEEKA